MPPRKNIELQGIDKKRAAARMRGPSSSRPDIPVDARSEWAEGPKSFESLDISELIRNLDEQGPRAEILRRVSVDAAPIRSAIKESGLSVRKNADLDGYRSYETNIRQLRDAIVAIAMVQNPHTADDAEKVFKILNRIDAHHKRIIDDAQNKGIGVAAREPKQSDATLSMSGVATGRMGNTFVPVDLKVVSIGGSSNEAKQEEPEVLPMADVMKRTPEQAKPSPESPEGLRVRLKESLERVRNASRDAHGGNPLAVVNLEGTREFFQMYTAARKSLDAHMKGSLNGTDVEHIALPIIVQDLTKIENMSHEIAARVTENGIAQPAVVRQPSPETTPAVEPVPTTATPEKTPREADPILAVLREKHEKFKSAEAAYNEANKSHYGAYRANTGTFWERSRRGVGKFFGIGPKDTPELKRLHAAMNDARSDFANSRFAAMDARIKDRIAKNPKLAQITWGDRTNRDLNGNLGPAYKNLTEWNVNLKRRESLRTVVRSSRDQVKIQYEALGPEQQNAIGSVRKALTGAFGQEVAQILTGTTAGYIALTAGMGLKAASAYATFGLSLVAGLAGAKVGDVAARGIVSVREGQAARAKDKFEVVSARLAGELDLLDPKNAAQYDSARRAITKKIIGVEEARDSNARVVRTLGTVGGALAAGDLMGDAIDLSSTEGSNGKIDGTNGPDTEPRPTPEQGGGRIDGTNAAPAPEGTIEKTNMSKMVAGDNPWDLAEEKHFSEKFEDMTKTERDRVIDSAMDRLRADEALRARIFPGYDGTTFTDMQIGQDVNLTAYEKLIDEQLAVRGHASETLAPLSETETKAAAIPEIESENPEPGEGVEEEGDIFENERPSENIEDRRTPEQAAEQDQAFRNMNAETGVSVADIARERMSLYTTLHDAPKSGGIFSTLFGGSSVSAHEYLEDQPLNKVAELSAQRAEYIEMIAKQNNVDATALQNWANYMKQLAPDIANRPPEMTFGAYVDVVAEELAKHAKQA